MEVRRITLAEKLDFAKMEAIAFLYTLDVEKERQKISDEADEPSREESWGCFREDGKLVSGVINTHYGMYYDGHVVGMGGIGGVASLPEGRMRGGIRAIMRSILRDDYENGAVFSLLYPFSHEYYRKFGYELCHEQRTITLDMKQLAKHRMQGEARMLMPTDPTEPFQRVYARFAARYNCAVARSSDAWKWLMRGDPYKDHTFYYALSRGGEDTAYCILKKATADGKNLLEVRDYAFVDREALHDLLAFLGRLSAEYARLRMEVPDGFEISALIDEPYDGKIDRLGRLMARVTNVEKALRLMRHPQGEGAYRLLVRDAFMPCNEGVYAVRFGAEGTRVCREEEAPDLTLDVQTLAQLCLGYLSLDMALLKRGVELAGNHELLRRVFVRKEKWLTDKF